MKRRTLPLSAGLLSILALCYPAGAPGQQAPPEPPAIRVDVNLIQIDVTVADKQGRRIPNLTADDFEVSLDGKKQPVQNVLWVGRRAAESTLPATVQPGTVSVAGPTATTTRQLTRQQVRRTVAILVDDLSLSQASIFYARQSIRKFIEANLDQGDLVAIFRTSSGMSLLQQFSADRTQLLASLDRIRFGNRSQVDSLAAIQDDPLEAGGDPVLSEMARSERLRDEVNRRENQDMITAGMLGSMGYLVGGLRELPGRKSLILFSESVQLFDAPQSLFNPDMSREQQMRPGAGGGQRDRTIAALRSVTDLANRNGVSIYAIDPRGLQTLGITAQDAPANARRAVAAMNQRSFEFTASQDGMAIMAEDTGGQFFKGTNDITAALRDAVADQEDYYLLGFTPDAAMFDKAKSDAANFKLHRIQIRVKKSGLQVRHRKGFFGVSDEERAATASKLPPLVAAMMSPFRSADVPVRMTPLFAKLRAADNAAGASKGKQKKGESQAGGVVRVMVHVDASRFTFTDVPADAKDTNKKPWKTATVEFGVCLFDEENRIVAKTSQQQELRSRGEKFESLQRDGVVEQLLIPVPKPGAYQLRAAIVDKATGLTGSAAQFLRTPDLSKGQIESSDLVVNTESWEKGIGERGSPARRIFSPGEKLNYLMMVYNARTSPKTKMSQLETQVALYREGKRILLGPRSPLEVPDDSTDKDVTLSGSFVLHASTPPGAYTIEITVRDPLAPKKQQFTLRSIDFEVRPATGG